MKILIALALGLICITQAFASYEVIGETRECAIQTKIIEKTSEKGSSLLVIHKRDVYELAFESQTGSMKFYSSLYQDETPGRIMTFEATIMGPYMSRLSELRIYLSGVMMDCLIDK